MSHNLSSAATGGARGTGEWNHGYFYNVRESERIYFSDFNSQPVDLEVYVKVAE